MRISPVDDLTPELVLVLLEGVTVQNSPCWTIHAVYCENVIARGVTALGPTDVVGPNVDGINADSCTNMLIENCRFATCDDCIAVKSGRNEDGRRVGISSENVTIRNCVFERDRQGLEVPGRH